MALWRCPSTVRQSASFVARSLLSFSFSFFNTECSFSLLAAVYTFLFGIRYQSPVPMYFGKVFFILFLSGVCCVPWSCGCTFFRYHFFKKEYLPRYRFRSLIACTLHSLKSPPCSWDGLNMPGWGVLIFSLFKKYVHCLGYFTCCIFWCSDDVHHVMYGQAYAACSSLHITISINPTCTSLKVLFIMFMFLPTPQSIMIKFGKVVFYQFHYLTVPSVSIDFQRANIYFLNCICGFIFFRC